MDEFSQICFKLQLTQNWTQFQQPNAKVPYHEEWPYIFFWSYNHKGFRDFIHSRLSVLSLHFFVILNSCCLTYWHKEKNPTWHQFGFFGWAHNMIALKNVWVFCISLRVLVLLMQAHCCTVTGTPDQNRSIINVCRYTWPLIPFTADTNSTTTLSTNRLQIDSDFKQKRCDNFLWISRSISIHVLYHFPYNQSEISFWIMIFPSDILTPYAHCSLPIPTGPVHQTIKLTGLRPHPCRCPTSAWTSLPTSILSTVKKFWSEGDPKHSSKAS